MMITFAIRVPEEIDLDYAEETLREAAEVFIRRGILTEPDERMPAIAIERTQVPEFVPTGQMVQHGLGVQPETRLHVVTLLEAKAEVH